MGRLAKLAFWRRGTKKETPVEEIPTATEPEPLEAASNAETRPAPIETSSAALAPADPASPAQAESRSPSIAAVTPVAASPAIASLAAASPASGSAGPSSAKSSPMKAKSAAPASPPKGAEASLPLPTAALQPVVEEASSARSSAPSQLALAAAPSPQKAADPVAHLESIAEPPKVLLQDRLQQVPQRVAFDIAAEQVWAEASQALGMMVSSSLQSQKWDKRVQALKAASASLQGADLRGMAKPGSTGVLGKGLRLDERARSWRSLCQVLNILLRDKVLPVRLAAHTAMMDVFANCQGLADPEEIHFALSILLQHLLDRLGDSNLRLHESARRVVVFSAEHAGLLGLAAVFERLKAQMAGAKGGQKAQVLFGVLDTVNQLVHHFPGHRGSADEEDEDEANRNADSWTEQDVFPFIAAGLDDALGARVRNTAVRLAVSVYQTFGLDAMQPLLSTLRPAKKSLLKQKFEESEVEGADEQPGDDGMSMAGQSNADWSAMGGQDADLMVHGQGFGRAPGQLPPLPGALMYDMDEELFMDGILEDVGMVFAGADTCAMGAPRHLLPGMMEHPYMSLEEMEEQFYLEQQLRELGIELEMDEGGEGMPFSPEPVHRAHPQVAPIVGVGGAKQQMQEEDDMAVISWRSHSGQGAPQPAAEEHSSSVLLEVC